MNKRPLHATGSTQTIGKLVVAIVLALLGLTIVTFRARASPPLPQPETSRAFPHYTFDVDLNYNYHSLGAVEQVVVPNPSSMTLSKLVFNVPAAHSAGTFLLHDISIGEQPAEFDFAGTLLTVTLPTQLAPADVVTVTFNFSVFASQIDANIESFASANLGYTDDVLIVGYWYVMLAPYRAGQGWLTVPWYPVGDPFASESADYTATITATPGVEIVAGGEMTREGDIWHFELPRGRTFAFIASPNYWQMDVTLDGVTFSLYTFAEHVQLAPVAMQTIVQSAWLYDSLYGPYPYTTLRVAEVNGPWSIEFAGLVTLGAEEFADYNGTQRNRLVRIAAHEVSHQWWYNVVGNDQARQPWLDEGLARFNELRYYEFYSPDDVWWWRNAVLSNAEPLRTVDSTIYDFHYHNSYIAVVYNRGAMFLDELRTRIGQAAFNAFMRDLYARDSFQIITSGEFFAALARHTQVDVRPAIAPFFAATPFDAVHSSDGSRSPAPTQVRPASQNHIAE